MRENVRNMRENVMKTHPEDASRKNSLPALFIPSFYSHTSRKNTSNATGNSGETMLKMSTKAK